MITNFKIFENDNIWFDKHFYWEITHLVYVDKVNSIDEHFADCDFLKIHVSFTDKLTDIRKKHERSFNYGNKGFFTIENLIERSPKYCIAILEGLEKTKKYNYKYFDESYQKIYDMLKDKDLEMYVSTNKYNL